MTVKTGLWLLGALVVLVGLFLLYGKIRTKY